jgi:hypothetical protein
MRVPVGILAALGFLAAVIVHALTFVSINAADIVPGVWLLHFGCFAVFVPFFLSFRRIYGAKPSYRELLSTMPVWAAVLVIGLAAYAIVNFVLFLGLSEGATAEVRNGHYVLHRHGTVLRELSADEYRAQKVYVTRGFSGHWMLFYLVPAIYFLAIPAVRRVQA